MRKLYVLAVVIVITGLLTGGCAKKKVQRIEVRPTLSEVKIDKHRYLKKTALVLTNQVQTPAGHEHGRRLMRQMEQTLIKRVDDLLLIPENDPGLAALSVAWAAAQRPDTVRDIARTARQTGFQTLLRANLLAVQTSSRKEGFWLLRRDRFYVTVKVVLDVLDPFTAAKMASIVAEKKVKINELDFESYNAGEQATIDELDKAIDRMAEDLARQAGRIMQETPWRCAVLNIQGNQVVLAAGATERVAVGDRLTVFEGRRQLHGKTGEVFFVPGFRLGEIEVIAVNGPTSVAQMTAAINVQPDDFVVPTR